MYSSSVHPSSLSNLPSSSPSNLPSSTHHSLPFQPSSNLRSSSEEVDRDSLEEDRVDGEVFSSSPLPGGGGGGRADLARRDSFDLLPSPRENLWVSVFLFVCFFRDR